MKIILESAEMPPVSNRPLYVYRVFIKWFSFFIFGLGSLFLGLLILPLLRLFLHPRRRFSRSARALISRMLRFFVFLMHIMGIVNLESSSKDVWKNLGGKILVANHPSLLDVVMLFSLIPNADCIVNASLSQNIVRGVIRELYILNSLDFQELSRSCIESLEERNCLIIFPEGTRTLRSGAVTLKKGAARISLSSGAPVVPVRVGGSNKYGLGKKDPWLAFNRRERYVYRLDMGQEISPENYRSLPPPAAAKALTEEIGRALFGGEWGALRYS